MSRSVIIPTSRSPSVTGIDPASACSMNRAASRAMLVGTHRLDAGGHHFRHFHCRLHVPLWPSNELAGAAFLRLGDVFGQEIVGRDELVLLVEDFDRPANHAGVFALQRFRPDAELNPHGIARIERRQESQILEAGVGEDGPGSGSTNRPAAKLRIR